MRAKKALPGSIFLTASQSLQGLQSEMRQAEHVKRGAIISHIDGDLDGTVLQQAPSTEERDATPRYGRN